MPSPAELTRWTAGPAPPASPPRSPGGSAVSWRRSLVCALAKHPIRLLATPAGFVVVMLLAAVLPSASDGIDVRAARHTADPARAPAAAHRRALGLAVPDRTGAAAGAGTQANCEQTTGAGYANPLAEASVSAKRIDQGVDYTAGYGALTAIGPGTITVLATSDTGWPGAFIEYQLTAGPAAGCFVFYAEGISPVAGLQVGQAVAARQPLATIIPGYSSGLEIGWGAGVGTETYAAQMGEWSAMAEADNIPTRAGKSFSALVASLGGPPGKIEQTAQ